MDTYIEVNPRLKANVRDEPKKMPQPISGYEDEPLLSLEEACKPLEKIIDTELLQNIMISKMNSAQPENGLSLDESASIHLYTMEWKIRENSLYAVLNRTLRSADRGNLRPWFKYLKLFLTAFFKLPSTEHRIVWRGVPEDLTDLYPKGKKITWWGVSSCSSSISVLQFPQYTGTSGIRTMFSIETNNGKLIRSHSYFQQEDEILLPPGIYLEVVDRFSSDDGLNIVHLRETIPPYKMLTDPFDFNKLKSDLSESKPSSNASTLSPKKENFPINDVELELSTKKNDLSSTENEDFSIKPVEVKLPPKEDFSTTLNYLSHIDTCANESVRKPPQKKSTRNCCICFEGIALDEYEGHVYNCHASSLRNPSNVTNTKTCKWCSERIDEDDYFAHIDRCATRSLQKPPKVKNTKACVVCSERIDVEDYIDHIDRCATISLRKSSTTKNTKEYSPSSKRTTANDYEDRLNRNNDRSSSGSTTPNNTQECFICFKNIANADYERHVNKCFDNSSRSVNTKPPNQQLCFTCSSPVDQSKTSGCTVPCRTRHIYCTKCLQRSMNEFIQSNTAPVCNSTLCDYQLSRYDIECLPLQPNIIQQLLPLVKTTQRPQCPSCRFYVECNTMNDLQKHVASCSADNLVPCEHCQCLYNGNRLTEHERQCRTASASQRQQTLIDFIVPRTKYPVTAQQMRVFLEHRRKNRLPLDVHAIIDALAEFEGTFPFEVPTRDCDICAESYVYDDIFVVGCEESHKLCYGCFADSCKAKMNSNEMLTCPMCTYQLQDGELKQLRVSDDEKRKFLDYQTQKTFSTYTGDNKGVIKCPNKDCKWVAEAQNPNDRFLVECPLCHYQFCSLCNQQYHFRTTCQQIPELTQRWFYWCNTERGNYWQARARDDANFQAQLEDYERQKAANAQRNDELRQRYDELIADEQYKAGRCRLCPNCGRVVEHLAGCDLMVCGRNYHGGDDQSGCGHGFKFSQAPKYVPLNTNGPQQVTNNMPAPAQQKTVVHEGVQCDSCHNQVQGIRFDCVHCSSLIFCEKCEQRATLEHSNQIRDQNKQQHVFQLITKV